MPDLLKKVDMSLLHTIADMDSMPTGAFNIRKNGQGIARQSSENITIEPKKGNPGIDIYIKPFTKGEEVHIPVIITETGINDKVYNDFYVGEGADVLIVAGCGIHNCGGEKTEHDGIHRFFIGKNAKVKYVEKHYGEGEGTGERILNPVTEVTMEEGSYCEMEMIQLYSARDRGGSRRECQDSHHRAPAHPRQPESPFKHDRELKRQKFERADSLPLRREGSLRAGVLSQSGRQHRLPRPCPVRLDNHGQGEDTLHPGDNRQRPAPEAHDFWTDRRGS